MQCSWKLFEAFKCSAFLSFRCFQFWFWMFWYTVGMNHYRNRIRSRCHRMYNNYVYDEWWHCGRSVFFLTLMRMRKIREPVLFVGTRHRHFNFQQVSQFTCFRSLLREFVAKCVVLIGVCASRNNKILFYVQ